MHAGPITQYIDVAQLTLYAFWIFFACLIVYLRREDKREGYPLENERSQRIRVRGWPEIPPPKLFRLRDGTVRYAPAAPAVPTAIQGTPTGPWPGAPLEPVGNPMLAALGPGSYALRAEVPDRTVDGATKIVPLRIAPGFFIPSHDPDPRGMTVVGGDGVTGGVVSDVWVDRAETVIRYLEVEVSATPGSAATSRRVLVPINFVRIFGSRRIARVRSIMGAQFADAPLLQSTEQITLREEERVMAYYGGGTLYATPARAEPLL